MPTALSRAHETLGQSPCAHGRSSLRKLESHEPVEQVMMPLPTVQQVVGNRALQRMLQRHVQRTCSGCEEVLSPVAAVPPVLTGSLPNRLKTGVEALSGISLDSVRVHYNSPEPARVEALAYTLGTDIHIAPGQEQHLAHEAWHVVQQQQGRVRPTMQLAGTAINDDSSLEREADSMGVTALAGGGFGPRQPVIQAPELSATQETQTNQLAALSQPQHRIVQRTTIVQPGYASGDMFGIAAALILDDTLNVVVTTENQKPKSDQTDVGEKISDYYLSLPFANRTKLVEVSSIRHPSTRDNTLIDNSIRELERLDAGEPVADHKEGVSHGTWYIGRNWNRNAARNRNRIRTAWDLDKSGQPGQPNTSKDQKIGKWLADKKDIRPKDKKIVILWSRFSGKKGDVHLEHDTSFEGMRQLIAGALHGNDLVIIAGDKPIKSEKKYDEMAAKYPGKVFNLTAFWEKPTSWCQSRNDQFKLYDYLDRKAASVKHLGFRSGNLEAFALMGHTVRYLEEPGSKGGGRMAQWHGKGIGYERIPVSEVPTASGKYLKGEMSHYQPDERLPENVVRPLWAPGRRPAEGREKEPKPLAIGTYTKGFAAEDLEEINRYLNARV